MDNETYAELKHIADRLAVVVVVDANPENWAANGVAPGAMTAKQRGDAYWSRKLAAQSLTVLTKVQSAIGIIERHASNAPPDDPTAGLDAAASKEIDKKVEQARRTATRMLAAIAERDRAKRH